MFETPILGDCLEWMPTIRAGSVDMILADLPYGRTRHSKDVPIPFAPLWEQYRRVIKPNGCIALFADGLFMAELMLSNPKWWRYNLVWDKHLITGFLNANRQPLRRHEEVCIFYGSPPTYNPQKVKGEMNHSKGKAQGTPIGVNNYGEYYSVDNRDVLGDMKHPTSILSFPKTHPSVAAHRTEKPVALLEWLIRSYTNPGEVVLDNVMGSGSTGVACVNTGRSFIGIDNDPECFNVAQRRIAQAIRSAMERKADGIPEKSDADR